VVGPSKLPKVIAGAAAGAPVVAAATGAAGAAAAGEADGAAAPLSAVTSARRATRDGQHGRGQLVGCRPVAVGQLAGPARPRVLDQRRRSLRALTPDLGGA